MTYFWHKHVVKLQKWISFVSCFAETWVDKGTKPWQNEVGHGLDLNVTEMTFLGLNPPPKFYRCHRALPMVTLVSKDSLNWWVHASTEQALFLFCHVWTARRKLSCDHYKFPISYSNFSSISILFIHTYQTGNVPSLSCIFIQRTVLLW